MPPRHQPAAAEIARDFNEAAWWKTAGPMRLERAIDTAKPCRIVKPDALFVA